MGRREKKARKKEGTKEGRNRRKGGEKKREGMPRERKNVYRRVEGSRSISASHQYVSNKLRVIGKISLVGWQPQLRHEDIQLLRLHSSCRIDMQHRPLTYHADPEAAAWQLIHLRPSIPLQLGSATAIILLQNFDAANFDNRCAEQEDVQSPMATKTGPSNFVAENCTTLLHAHSANMRNELQAQKCL